MDSRTKAAPERTDFAHHLRRLSSGGNVVGVSTTRGGYRRVNAYWLGLVADRIEALEDVLARLTAESMREVGASDVTVREAQRLLGS